MEQFYLIEITNQERSTVRYRFKNSSATPAGSLRLISHDHALHRLMFLARPLRFFDELSS